jgi:hypothetical protein
MISANAGTARGSRCCRPREPLRHRVEIAAGVTAEADIVGLPRCSASRLTHRNKSDLCCPVPAALSDRAAQLEIAIDVESARTSQLETAVVRRVRTRGIFEQARKYRARGDGEYGADHGKDFAIGAFSGTGPVQSGSDLDIPSRTRSPPFQFRKAMGLQVRSNSTRHTAHGDFSRCAKSNRVKLMKPCAVEEGTGAPPSERPLLHRTFGLRPGAAQRIYRCRLSRSRAIL